jgi:predicted metal-dependent HD superfamily phosphohydrolase
MPDTDAWLKNNWASILASLPVDPSGVDQLFQELLARYREEYRFYHNLDHLRQVVGTAVILQRFAHDFTAVQLAAWFHDAVYDPRANDNEERSATYAVASLQAINLPENSVATVQRLILATKSHQAAPGDGDAHVLLDADLAILGSAPERYDAYSRAIRQEYAWVPAEQYRYGRRQVLASFLQRDHIYHTPPMTAAYEQPARRNIERELTLITSNQ